MAHCTAASSAGPSSSRRCPAATRSRASTARWRRRVPGRGGGPAANAHRAGRPVAAHVPGGRLLDVGLRPRPAARRGPPTGLRGRRARAVARRGEPRPGELWASTSTSDARGPRLDGERYDAIVLADVIEHLDDPVARSTAAVTAGPRWRAVVVTPDPSRSPPARGRALVGLPAGPYVPAPPRYPPRADRRAGPRPRRRRARSCARSRLATGCEGSPSAAGGSLPRSSALAGPPPRRRWCRCPWATSGSLLARRSSVRRPRRAAGHRPRRAMKRPRRAARLQGGADDSAGGREMPVGAADRALLVDDACPDDTVGAALARGLRRSAPPGQPRLRREPEDVLRHAPPSTVPTSS